MVVFALVPYLCLSAALQPLSPIIASAAINLDCQLG